MKMSTESYSRLVSRQTARFALVAISVCLLGGVKSSATAQPISDCDLTREQLCRRIKHAVFYRPADTQGLLPIELAPLIVQQVQDDPHEHSYDSLVSVFIDSSSRLAAERDIPTVYFNEYKVRIQGIEFSEYVFAMFFHKPDDPSGVIVSRKLHVLAASDGFPVMAVPWNGIIARRVLFGQRLFVSDELEDRARKRFGPPLANRCYSIEQAYRDKFSSRVAGTFAPGPIPMGLYVYLGPSGSIMTVRCRCSPSLMDNVVETKEYRLLPITNAPEHARIRFGENWSQLVVQETLRWPFDPPTREDKSDEDR